MALLVDQLDAIDSVRTACGAAYLMHQLEQNPGVQLGCDGIRLLYAQMQHHETLARQPHEHRDAERPAGIGYREQGLDSFDVPDADGQTAVVLMDLGNAVSLDGLLDPEAHAMLVDVEEQELFQRGALVDR